MVSLKRTFHALKEWDKRWAFKFQGKFGLSNYQMFCACFAKGFIIGAILLCRIIQKIEED